MVKEKYKNESLMISLKKDIKDSRLKLEEKEQIIRKIESKYQIKINKQLKISEEKESKFKILCKNAIEKIKTLNEEGEEMKDEENQNQGIKI